MQNESASQEKIYKRKLQNFYKTMDQRKKHVELLRQRTANSRNLQKSCAIEKAIKG